MLQQLLCLRYPPRFPASGSSLIFSGSANVQVPHFEPFASRISVSRTVQASTNCSGNRWNGRSNLLRTGTFSRPWQNQGTRLGVVPVVVVNDRVDRAPRWSVSLVVGALSYEALFHQKSCPSKVPFHDGPLASSRPWIASPSPSCPRDRNGPTKSYVADHIRFLMWRKKLCCVTVAGQHLYWRMRFERAT